MCSTELVQLAHCSVNTWTSYYRDQFTHHIHNSLPSEQTVWSSVFIPSLKLHITKQRWQAPGPQVIITGTPQYPKASRGQSGDTPKVAPYPIQSYRVAHTCKLSEKVTVWGAQYQCLWPGSARATPYLRVSPCSTHLAINCPALQITSITYLHIIALVILQWVIKHTGLQLPPRNTGHSEPADALK